MLNHAARLSNVPLYDGPEQYTRKCILFAESVIESLGLLPINNWWVSDYPQPLPLSVKNCIRCSPLCVSPNMCASITYWLTLKTTSSKPHHRSIHTNQTLLIQNAIVA